MGYKTGKTHFILIKNCQTEFKSKHYFEKKKPSPYYVFLMPSVPLYLAETVYLTTYV